MRALGVEHFDAGRSRGVNSTLFVNRKAVGAARDAVGAGRRPLILRKVTAVGQCAIRLDVECDQVFALRVVDVQHFLVATEENAVGATDFVGNFDRLSAWRDVVHSGRQRRRRGRWRALLGIRSWLGEVNASLRTHHEIVRAAKRLALESIGENRLASLRIDHADLCLTWCRLHRDQTPLRIPRQSIRAVRVLEKRRRGAIGRDAGDAICLCLGEDQAAVRHPYRPFSALEARLDDNHFGSGSSDSRNGRGDYGIGGRRRGLTGGLRERHRRTQERVQDECKAAAVRLHDPSFRTDRILLREPVDCASR